jgi:hypothetical protein
MRDRPLAPDHIQNIYELTSIRFGPIPGGGWSMASRFFYRCPEGGAIVASSRRDFDAVLSEAVAAGASAHRWVNQGLVDQEYLDARAGGSSR